MTKRVNNAFVLSQSQKVKVHKRNPIAAKKSAASFQEVMHSLQNQEIRLTRHAQTRLETRGIKLSDQEIKKVTAAINRAGVKGVKDAVIVMDNKLLIASVANKTIITAAKQQDIEEKLITNIDGAIFI